MNTYILEPTAALVLNWASSLYNNNPVTKKFMDIVDIHSGDELLTLCEQENSLGRPLLCARKNWYHRRLEHFISTHKQVQVILLASGKTPLPIQLLDRYNNNIAKIVEVDLAGIEDKKAIYRQLEVDINKICLLECDMTRTDLIDQCKKEGAFDTTLPTIVVLEGISYYISRGALEMITTNFKKQLGSFVLLVDTLCPLVPKEPLSHAIHNIFLHIKDYCQISLVQPYAKTELEEVFKQGAINYYTLKDLEYLYLEANPNFAHNPQGVINFLEITF